MTLLLGALTAGLAAGAVSLAYFLALLTGIPALALEAVAAAGVVAWWWRRRGAGVAQAATARSGFEWLLLAAFGLLLAAAAAAYWMESSRAPGGGWDAWSIWNLRARFLYRGGANWRDAFSPVLLWSHPDYPLLVPSLVAACWQRAGGETGWAAVLTGGLFTLATPLALAGAVGRLRGREAGWLAGIVLLGTPYFIIHGATQYADVPVGFFITAAVALLALQDVEPSRELAVLAGLSAGFAAWTKNEGLMFAAILPVARATALLASRDAGRLRRELPPLLAGLVPVLAVVFYFRVAIAPANANLGGGAIDFARIPTVALAFATHLWGFGQLIVTPFLLLAAYVAVARPDIASRRAGVYTCFLTFALMLAGYAAVYVITPGDLNWFLDTSLDRVLLQVWPLAILAAFTASRGYAALQRQGQSQ